MAIRSLSEVARVLILAGNHDWLRQGHEFFKFLNTLPNVRFITEPWEDDDLKGESAMFLPHSKQPAKDWADFDLSHYRYVFMHQTIKGSIASNGQKMEGEELPDLSAAGKIYSGDIHVPQIIGPIEYVGSPYAVHFGDKFVPRVLLLEANGNPVDLHFKTISRFSAKVSTYAELRRINIKPGDQVKLTVELDESEKAEWSSVKRQMRRMVEELGGVAAGIELKVKKSSRRMLSTAAASTSLDAAAEIERWVLAEELSGDVLDTGLGVIEK